MEKLNKAISNYITYNHWANKRLTHWLKSLDAELVYKDVSSSFASIDLTLQRMKNAQNFWYAVITKEDLKKIDETIKIKSIDWVIEELLAVSQKMVDTYLAFSDEELMTKVASPIVTKSRYDFIVHVINHNSYHRGQIVTIARLFGAITNIPETDYEVYLWIEQTNSKNSEGQTN